MNNKELELQLKEHVAHVKQAEQRYQETYIGSIQPHRGHTLFEINMKTGEIVKAEFAQTDYIIGKTNENNTRKKVIIKQDCVYISALRKETAIKKFLKGSIGDKFK